MSGCREWVAHCAAGVLAPCGMQTAPASPSSFLRLASSIALEEQKAEEMVVMCVYVVWSMGRGGAQGNTLQSVGGSTGRSGNVGTWQAPQHPPNAKSFLLLLPGS
jgi:hypothetical protein